MSTTTRRLEDLDLALAELGEEAMTVSELDGFLAGLHVCPDIILPGEWLAHVWTDPDGGPEPTFESGEHVQELTAEVLWRYNAVGDTLQKRPRRYDPVLIADEDGGEVIWEGWVNGFGRAMALRAEALNTLMAGEQTSLAMGGMVALLAIANGENATAQLSMSEEQIETLGRSAPVLIPELVRTLYAARLGAGPAGPAVTSGKKPGRNDPCPCGSGLKYKKCCGAS